MATVFKCTGSDDALRAAAAALEVMRLEQLNTGLPGGCLEYAFRLNRPGGTAERCRCLVQPGREGLSLRLMPESWSGFTPDEASHLAASGNARLCKHRLWPPPLAPAGAGGLYLVQFLPYSPGLDRRTAEALAVMLSIITDEEQLILEPG